jgi:hypothetical protein
MPSAAFAVYAEKNLNCRQYLLVWHTGGLRHSVSRSVRHPVSVLCAVNVYEQRMETQAYGK